MSEAKFAAVRELLAENRYEEARTVLRTIDTDEAKKWLDEIEEIDPSLRFSIDSSLLFQLGEQLVTKPSIALSELVKNAYDADATTVTITMEKIGRPGGTIMVEDNGHGMTFDEIRQGWMRIATTAKRTTQTSRLLCRPLTGAKGVGRFAARRLGSKLTLQSIAQTEFGTKESVLVEFDWIEDFAGGADLGEIPVTYTRQEVNSQTPTGVHLLITNAYDAWTEDEINKLRRDLLSLQTPFPKINVRVKRDIGTECEYDPGFDINFIIEGEDEYEMLSGGLGDALLSTAWAVLDGKVDGNGRAYYSIRICSTGEIDAIADHTNDYIEIGGGRFRIYYFVYRKEYIADSGFSIAAVRQKGRAEGGVAIYLDGFRVFPYGEPGDDWLQLDEYANRNVDLAAAISPPDEVLELAKSPATGNRPYLLLPKNYQLFGAVSISQIKHPEIQLNVSRQRLIDNAAVLKLSRFVQNGIYWMTMKYAAVSNPSREIRRTQRRRSVPEIIQDAKTKLDAVAKPSQVVQPPATIAKPPPETLLELPTATVEEVIQDVSKSLEDAVVQAKEEEQERISELSMLRLLASAGTTVMIMNHQLRHLISAVLQIHKDLERMKSHVPASLRSDFDDVTDRTGEWHEMVDAQISQLALLIASDKTERRKRHVAFQMVENVKKPMKYYMKLYGVSFENNIPPDLRTPPVYAAELYAILLNILSNALKAVTERTERRIAVNGGRKNGSFFLQMKDTGIGIPRDRREVSFEPFVTTSVMNPLLGPGTGLGLSVVRDIVGSYDGSARFIDVDAPWRTCIEILLPDNEAVQNV